MPVAQEFTVYLEDRAGALGKICRKLADHGVNILALHSFPSGGKSVTRFIVDNPEAAKSALVGERLTLTVSDVLLLKIQNRPGEIARVAARLGEADININYAYCGLESRTNNPLVFFGVSEVSQQPKFWNKTRPLDQRRRRGHGEDRRGEPPRLAAGSARTKTAPTGTDSDCTPGTRHFGNMRRNSLRGPSFKQWDFALYKNTQITERIELQLRADFFNILNHPNFANPYLPAFIVDPGINGFTVTNGRETGVGHFPITATGDVGVGNPFLGGGGPRGIQLAAKFMF